MDLDDDFLQLEYDDDLVDDDDETLDPLPFSSVSPSACNRDHGSDGSGLVWDERCHPVRYLTPPSSLVSSVGSLNQEENVLRVGREVLVLRPVLRRSTRRTSQGKYGRVGIGTCSRVLSQVHP